MQSLGLMVWLKVEGIHTRVNIYAEEITDRIEIISKETADGVFTGLRFYLELPCTVVKHNDYGNTENVRGPFIHRPGDDDSAAVTFWGKRDMLQVLKKAVETLESHYDYLQVTADDTPIPFDMPFLMRGGRVMFGPNRHPLVFQEDDALLHDLTYPGIRGWWLEVFGKPFPELTTGFLKSENGPYTTYLLPNLDCKDGTGPRSYYVNHSVYGYSVERLVQ